MSPPPLPSPDEARATLGVFSTNKDLFIDLVGKVEEEWNKFCKIVDETLKRGEHIVNSDSPWGSFTQWVADVNPFVEALVETLDDIRKAFERLRKAIDDLLGKIRFVADRSAPVLQLCEHSFIYLSQVFAPLGNLYTEAGGVAPNETYWGGPTRDDYKARVVPDQQGALDRVTDHVEKLSSWLAQTAAKNTEYMVSIVENLSPIPGNIAAAAANAAAASGDFVSAFFAIDNLADAIGACVEAVLNLTAGLFGFLASVVEGIRDLAVVKYERRDLSDGRWPQSVAG